MIAAQGFAAVNGDGLFSNLIVPAIIGPPIAFLVAGVPDWVVVMSAGAIAVGTFVGGWRIIKTLGTRIIEMDVAQGFAAQAAGATVILAASSAGYPLSPTHVISGAIMGSGAGKRLSAVRWGVAGNIVGAWTLTLPAAAITPPCWRASVSPPSISGERFDGPHEDRPRTAARAGVAHPRAAVRSMARPICQLRGFDACTDALAAGLADLGMTNAILDRFNSAA